MQEINERDLQNVSGGGEELHWYDTQARHICSACQGENPGKCGGSLELMIQYLRYVNNKLQVYIDCPYFRD